jgi:hypothetical protein
MGRAILCSQPGCGKDFRTASLHKCIFQAEAYLSVVVAEE